MLAIAAREMGYRVQVYSPEPDSPAGHVADKEHVGAYDDLEKVRAFAKEVDVVTFEFENVPHAAARVAAEETMVRPDGGVLHVTQNRLREKSFLHENGFPVTPFRAINTVADLTGAANDLGLPAVLKTASFGYDGKGQQKLEHPQGLDQAFQNLNGQEGIFEAWVPFTKEVSVVAARTLDGTFSAFPVFENSHSNHILDTTFSPASIRDDLAAQAHQLAAGILGKLGVVGLLTVEMFVTEDHRLVVNELAPRTHNSGHLTIDGCATSQFEQQVRAVCGLPLGSTELLKPTAMANLIGHLWNKREPDWAAALRAPNVKLHLYGKATARPGRKMGHLTALGETVQEALDSAVSARNRLTHE
jgi:5-(carboxyamino)imidazole ribonucleotide synthase